ncbi:hypothetical protein Y1Q_0021441 [Alligator mississippiensis]|uniref:Uncharacterized protein n=1 Tax=Alligator mississippiensis TaxID=8496 RepID=A0A151PAL2_ALLMI|nr:hypothetical protein Y1Q_0021441 [Alligator mississippiensis]
MATATSNQEMESEMKSGKESLETEWTEAEKLRRKVMKKMGATVEVAMMTEEAEKKVMGRGTRPEGRQEQRRMGERVGATGETQSGEWGQKEAERWENGNLPECKGDQILEGYLQLIPMELLAHIPG